MKRANGFTLIEMLVALAVFSIAALALLRLDGFAVATTADLAARAGATLVAENEAALIATDPAPPILGTSSREHGNGGRNFVIRQAVTPTADQRLVRVDLTVIERGSGARALLTLIKRVR